MVYEIINDTFREIEELAYLQEYIEFLVGRLGLENCEFNIIITDNKKIRQINRDYRNIDRETDVISFALEEGMKFPQNKLRILGDIYISIDKCYLQADEYGHSKNREICFLATHGILHLLGYDHTDLESEREMFSLQNELLDGYNIKRES